MLNVLFLALGCGGGIVSALTLPDGYWKIAIIGFFALVGLLGLVLIARDSGRFETLLNWPFFDRQVPLHVAARHIYEAAEKANVADFLVSPDDSAEKKLSHLKMLLMVDDRIRLFAVKPPSTASRLLSKSERIGELYPSDEDNSDLHLVTLGDPEYIKASIPRRDLRSAIKIYLSEYVDETKQLRAGKWPS